MDRKRLLGVVLVVMSAIGFGSGGLFARPAYAAGIDWLTLMAWRFLIASGCGWALVLASPSARRALRSMDRRIVLGSMGLGVWYVSNTATYYAGITTTPLSLAALIVYIYPPVVAVLALFFGRPLQGRRAWVALGLAVSGVVLSVGSINASEMPPLPGLISVVLAPLFYSGWIILAARLAGERSDRVGSEASGSANATVTGAVILSTTGLVYWIWTLSTGHPVLPWVVPMGAWPGILGVGVVAGFLATQGFYAGAQLVGAAQASLISTVEPLWTIVAAYVILGEVLAPLQLLGGALILVGVVVSQTAAGTGDRAGAPGAGGGPGSPVGDSAGGVDAAGAGLPRPIVHLGEE